MTFPIRSPRHPTGGIVILARVIDKIRLHAAGQLPDGYHVGFMEGNRTFDDRLCRFLQVDFGALTARTLAGGSDEEILEWCVWNGFLQKRGWRDNGSPGLIQQKAGAGFAGREDIATWFDLIDAEEGHTPPA